MENKYMISGMTCNGCVAKVKKRLETVPGVKEVAVQLAAPQGKLNLDGYISIDVLQKAIGEYKIEAVEKEVVPKKVIADLPEKSFSTYKPLLLIIAFVAGVSLLTQYPFNDFSGMLWMRYFMAGFFLVFSFFKLLNLEGFATSYSMYDIVASRWKSWGYIYPFIELGLGILYLINVAPFLTNLITLIVLGVSSIGVIKSNLDKREIKCACLGDVFNLPMSTVTIVENVSMILMAAWMLFLL